jgi:PleD family two-component response regulator
MHVMSARSLVFLVLLVDAIVTALTDLPARVRPRSATRPEKPLRILFAEDNEINQVLATELLGERGHTVVVARNAEEAVAAVQRERFDVVLMDVQLPLMNGFEATRAIRALDGGGDQSAHRRHHGERAGRRPRAVPRGGHGRLHLQAHRRGRAGRGAA